MRQALAGVACAFWARRRFDSKSPNYCALLGTRTSSNKDSRSICAGLEILAVTSVTTSSNNSIIHSEINYKCDNDSNNGISHNNMNKNNNSSRSNSNSNSNRNSSNKSNDHVNSTNGTSKSNSMNI